MKTNNIFKCIISVVVCELAGVAGAIFTAPSISSGWYAGLVKPALNPPAFVFGPVWTMLYFLMGVALFLVWKNEWRVVRTLIRPDSKKPWNKWSERFWVGDLQKQNIIAVFAVQLLLNAIWTPVFFGTHRPDLAFFILTALWCAIIYTIVNFYRVSRAAAWLLLPYLLWVTFAGYLNFSIWLLNASPASTYTTEQEHVADYKAEWKFFDDQTHGAAFYYPETLPTEYIHPVDWPPQVQILPQPFSCTESGSEIAQAGKTQKRTVDGDEYCVTKESEGAAGSIYTMYTYSFSKNQKTIILTFTLRGVQCANYEDPQRTACEKERASFNTDMMAHKIIQSIAVK